MRALAVIVALTWPTAVAASCVDWKAMGRCADFEAATVVFDGVVERVELGDVATCAPERVVFKVERQWKGQPAATYTLLQGNYGRVNETMPDGHIQNRGCPTWGEADRFSTSGTRYIVFAAGSLSGLQAMGCGTSQAPNKRAQQRLNKCTAVRK